MINVTFQQTPNPNAGKFALGRPAVEGGGARSFASAAQAAQHPLAAALFALGDIVNVFMVSDFVTVTKVAEADWAQLVPRIARTITEHYA